MDSASGSRLPLTAGDRADRKKILRSLVWTWGEGLTGPDAAYACDNADAATEMLVSIGWLGPAPGLLCYADPLKMPQDRLPDEGVEGIACYEHPFAALYGHPELWDAVEQYRCGYRSEPSKDEWQSESAWSVSIWSEMRAVEARKREHKWQARQQS